MLATPFSNIQLELLKIYAAGVPDEYLPELRDVISRYLFEKASDEAQRQWDARGYDETTLQQWLDPAE